MEYSQEQYIEQLKKDKEVLKEMISSLSTKKGNEEYKILRNKLSVTYAKIKYHTDPEARNKRLEDYNRWYNANKKKPENKKYYHNPI